MSIFASDDFFEISLKYIEKTTNSGLKVPYILNPEKESDKLILQDKQDQVQTLSTQWVHLKWKEQNEIRRKCTMMGMDGHRHVDYPMYQALILETAMRRWDIEENGKKIPCTKEFIGKLDPQIAIYLVEEYFLKTQITETDLGN